MGIQRMTALNIWGHPRLRRWLLGLSFLFGFSFGMWYCRHCAADLLSGVNAEQAFLCPVGAVPVLILLPFAVSRLFCGICPAFLYFICFCKSFLFSFVHFLVVIAFPESGWLLRCLGLFSYTVALPVLYFYWIRVLTDNRPPDLLVFSALLLIGYLDHAFIAPIWRDLLLFQKG